MAVMMVTNPNSNIIFMRKTDGDVAEIVRQTRRVLQSDTMGVIAYAIHGKYLCLTKDAGNELDTNLRSTVRGTSQLVGMGVNGSLTGKHADTIFTDDIINLKDRISRAEREHTKIVYQELQNIRNRGGRIINTGTPWHKDDAFALMPKVQRFDCYSTGLVPDDKIAEIRESMTKSLFAANYELRHIASEDVIFEDAQYFTDASLLENGNAHIDAAYGGEDGTAFTICTKRNGKYYVFGKLWKRHIDDVLSQCIGLRQKYLAGKIYCERNADKGYLAKEMRTRGERVVSYSETMNKHLKITSYLKAAWKDVYFLESTDPDYINEILDYNENAEHDDAPDSVASLIRNVYFSSDKKPMEDIW